MNRTVPFLLLAALLLAGLGWFFDRAASDENTEGDQSATTTTEVRPAQVTGIEPGSTVSEVAEPKIHRSDLEIGNQGSPNPLFVGPTLPFECEISGRIADYYLAPPAADLELDVFYAKWRRDNFYSYQELEDAKPIGKVLLDAQGQAHLKLELPANEKQESLARAALYLVPTSKGWQDSQGVIHLGSKTKGLMQKKLVFEPGTTIRVRAIGNIGNRDQRLSFWSLNVQRTDIESKALFSQFQTTSDDGSGPITANFALTEKGTYRLSAAFPSGVGVIPKVRLDPSRPPKELTILIEEFGTISGKMKTPYGKADHSVTVVAIAEDHAKGDILNVFGNVSTKALTDAFPPLTRSCTVQKNGTFQITGLAPGSYRLGFRILTPIGSQHGWFTSPAVTSGSTDVVVELPTTLLVLKFRNADGKLLEEAPEGLNIQLTHRQENAYEWDTEVEQEEAVDGLLGFPLFQGTSYSLITWGSTFSMTEKTLDGLFPPGVWELEIPLSEVPSGRLEWIGPKEDVFYQVFSEKLKKEVFAWGDWWYYRDRDFAVDLPPGRYLFQAEGRTATGNHGEVGNSRTPLGKQEQWVEVIAHETTTAQVELPFSGWLSIDLQATGQPNPELLVPDAFPPLSSVQFRKYSHVQQDVSFVVHNLVTNESTALTFQGWHGGSVYSPSYTLEPGKKERSLEVLAPGNYELEVRVPGFPLQRLPITIEAKKWTTAKVLLQGI